MDTETAERIRQQRIEDADEDRALAEEGMLIAAPIDDEEAD